MNITDEMWPEPAGQQLHSLGEELKRKIHRINQRRGGLFTVGGGATVSLYICIPRNR
jgi:hypothetical protein